MSKNYIHIKANGIRNELKDIRKAVDRLTSVLIAQQTNRHEKDYSNPPSGTDSSDDWGVYDYD